MAGRALCLSWLLLSILSLIVGYTRPTMLLYVRHQTPYTATWNWIGVQRGTTGCCFSTIPVFSATDGLDVVPLGNDDRFHVGVLGIRIERFNTTSVRVKSEGWVMTLSMWYALILGFSLLVPLYWPNRNPPAAFSVVGRRPCDTRRATPQIDRPDDTPPANPRRSSAGSTGN
jgi:hypothetical protein